MHPLNTVCATRASYSKHSVLLALVALYSAACLAVTAADPVYEPSSYKPKSGESLDQVIAQTMANSPLRIELLRQAFVNLNPNAFEPGKGKTPSLRLRKGVSLKVPDAEQLLQAVAQPKAELTSTSQSVNSDLDVAIERKSWIRFP